MPKNDGKCGEGARLLLPALLVLAAALIYVALVQTGTIAAPAQPQAPGQPASVAAAPAGCPASAARSTGDAELRQIVGDFDAYAEKARQDWGVPGLAIAIVKGDEVLLSKGYGMKAVGGSDPVTEHTVFQIASTSKAFTSTLVAMEVDRGAMEWDGKVADYLPGFRMNDSWVTREMTVTDAMAHRSGLSGYWGDGLMLLGYDDSYAVSSLRYAVPVSSFRSQYAYQNVVYSIPTMIVENTTGRSWQENLQSRIFTPLGMDGTSADYASFRAAKDVASPHMYSAAGVWPPVSEAVPAGSPYMNMTYLQPGAGGINSNAHDMANWLIFQMGDGTFRGQRLLSQKNLDYTHSPKTPIPSSSQNAQFYCQGWGYLESKYGPIISHSGAIGGYHNYVGFSPRDKVGIVILTNNVEASLADALFVKFFSMYYGNLSTDQSGELLEELGGQRAASASAALAAAAPSLPLPAYEGNYSNVPFGAVSVYAEGGNLTMEIGPGRMAFNLAPQGNSTFLATRGQMRWPVMFDAADNGSVDAVAVVIAHDTPVFARE